MKPLVILYAGYESLHQFDTVFDGKCAFERTLGWAVTVENSAGIIVLAGIETVQQCRCILEKNAVPVELVVKEVWTTKNLFEQIHTSCLTKKADFAVYAWADCPFLNTALTERMLETHTKYAAEYTFADGYPYGFAPEILDAGTASILAELSLKMPKKTGDDPISRDCLFSTMKADINSFEIETVISQKDWRLYRLFFACGNRDGLLACKSLFQAAEGENDVELLSAQASAMPEVLRTIPGFYNVQIEGTCSGACQYCPYPEVYNEDRRNRRMTVSDFRKLVKEMTLLSEQAVVSLSAWGEPLRHPDFTEFVRAVLEQEGLSVLIETDGLKITEEFASSLAAVSAGFPVRNNGHKNIIWIISLDAVSPETYGKIRGIDSVHVSEIFTAAVQSVTILQNYFPGAVYPQMVRINGNEEELEKFYRFWSDTSSPSGGNLIIQKYDDFCGMLSHDKPADLAPLERYPCWHIRRDMTIFADGSVPVCREYLCDGIIGNVFDEGIPAVWKKNAVSMAEQICKDYPDKCRKCDEYYTFNF